jgi:hypothetical protein
MATYTPTTGPGAGTPLNFHLLIDPPTRETQQSMSERVIPGATNSIVAVIGKAVTKIRGAARFDSYGGFKTFEGVVGTQGTLAYSEEPSGVPVIFVNMARTRVTPHDIHLANVEFWLIPPTAIIQTPAVNATSATAAAPGTVVATWSNILSARVSYGFDMRTGECQIVTPVRPTGSDYDQILTVVMGAGSNNITRFKGVIRDFQYSKNPNAVTTIAHGFLIRAIEYENGDETIYDPWTGSGGLTIQDLTGNLIDNAANIVMAVLTKANVPYTAANIKSSTAQYGGGKLLIIPFMWKSGGSGINSVPQYQDSGETAMSYIERYDAIDAELDSTNPNAGGRYRTFETLGGDVFRIRIGGRPQGTPNFTLTEGVDILSGQFNRSISQTRNYFVIKGQDRGANLGPEQYGIQGSNPFQPNTTKHTYQFSSDMLEMSTVGQVDAITGIAYTGMACQTVAGALQLEFNREIVSGSLETYREDTFGIAQTHLVQGGPGGTVGALGLAENVWVQSLEISVDDRGFTQRMSYLGGGLASMTTDLQQMLDHVQALT